MPTTDFAPMLALPYEKIEDDDARWNWDGQRKVDGIRAMVYLGPQGKRVLTRVKGKHSGEYGVKTEHLPWLPDTEKDYVFDGELLWGNSSRKCMEILGCYPTESLRRQEATHPMCFVAYDILVGWGINLCPRPYFQRREALFDHGSFVAMSLDHKFQISTGTPMPAPSGSAPRVLSGKASSSRNRSVPTSAVVVPRTGSR